MPGLPLGRRLRHVALAQQIDIEEDNPPDGCLPGASSSTQRVLATLYRDAIPYSFKLLPPEARTPEAMAEVCGCDLDLIVLCTLYRGKATKKPFLLLHSAASTLNEKLIGNIVGENLARADSEFVQRLLGYQIGAVPPLAHLNRVPVMMDGAVTRFARIWVPAGATNALVSVPTLVLARAISARIVHLDH